MAHNSRDSINLARIVRRLEDPDTPATPVTRAENIKHARTLAKRVYGSDTNPYEQRLSAIEHRLDAGSIASSIRRKAPSTRSYTSMIEPLLVPVATEIPAAEEKQADPSPGSPTSLGEEDPATLVAQMLLPSEELAKPVSTSLLNGATHDPAAKPSSLSPEFLTASRQTQDEISERLAEMAAQLRRNAQTFSAALEDDKEALAEADIKLDSNLALMQKERGRLGTYSSKSRGTTWIVIASILVVAVAWVIMFFVIRLT
ncbi:SubName: Full=Uncharacterized protein {ECO:0000313/EMBL:CCA71025.1} [Serendipita indica DSM 11827]|nr:SubName: Full=Uncharacterized protein {ECO:0000313/EMBL:CCA71025.1} [Serendipita indica DSM 11827]